MRTRCDAGSELEKYPKATYVLLDLLLNGSVGRIHPAWEGWSIDPKSGDLVTPLGWSLRATEVLANPLRYQELAAVKVELAETRCRLARSTAPPSKQEGTGLSLRIVDSKQ